MALYLYAIADAHAEAPEANGLHEQSLRVIRSQGLAALVSDQPQASVQVTESELWQHESAVEALMAKHDVLPARFGTVLASDEAVRALLTSREGEFSSALQRVAGAGELAVRAAWRERDARAPQSGSGYLEIRRDARRRADALARRLDARLAPLARASRARILPTQAVAVSAAYLVAKEQFPRFRAQVEQLAMQLADAVLLCTGPWPPYSFTEESEAVP